jgi:ribosomal-protein-alanine N-acetyltransferase
MTTAARATAPPTADEARIVLAPMRRRHLRAVLGIEQQVYPKPWTMGLFLGELAKPATRRYLVARSGAVVVGHMGVLYIGDEGHVTTVAVDPVWQRHQVATRLMAAQIHLARARGATAMTLEVRVSNTGAQELYRRFGFAPAGVRKGYYAETDEDALIMWAYDIDSDEMADRLARADASVLGTTAHDGFDVTDGTGLGR